MSESGVPIQPVPPQDSTEPKPKILVAIVADPDGGIALESSVPVPNAIALMFQMMVGTITEKHESQKPQIVRPTGFLPGIRKIMNGKR